MFYEDHEKSIYTPEGTDLKFDPLAVHRGLVYATDGSLYDLWNDWCGVDSDTGDVGPGAKERREAAGALAEERLVVAARKVFKVPDFPDGSDATALSYLRDYMEWMRGKGQRGVTS